MFSRHDEERRFRDYLMYGVTGDCPRRSHRIYSAMMKASTPTPSLADI
jgi:hypothetical protein